MQTHFCNMIRYKTYIPTTAASQNCTFTLLVWRQEKNSAVKQTTAPAGFPDQWPHRLNCELCVKMANQTLHWVHKSKQQETTTEQYDDLYANAWWVGCYRENVPSFLYQMQQATYQKGLVYQLHNQLLLLHYDYTALTRVQQHSIPWWCHIFTHVRHYITFSSSAVTSTAAGWHHWNFCYLKVDVHAFSALTLLGGRQDGQSAGKKWVVRYWRGYLSEVRCKWFAYGPADAPATPASLAQ